MKNKDRLRKYERICTNMKKLVLILFAFLLSGCSHDMNRREIDEINFVHVMGLII